MKKILMQFLLSALCATVLRAELVITEALTNEPGSYSSLEWIEIYNNSMTAIDISLYHLSVNDKIILLPSQIIEPEQYLVVCRKLFSDNNGQSFELYWGDNSSVWGDTQFEQMLVEPVEVSFSLPNESGLIQLIKSDETISSFSWLETGIDGVSWEKKNYDSLSVLQSVSRYHSTPGRINSVSLVTRDIALDSITVSMINGRLKYIVSMTNRGYEKISDVTVYFLQSMESIVTQEIQSEETKLIEYQPIFIHESQYFIESVVVQIYPVDDRLENDTLIFNSVGSMYPPLLITEFLANPTGGLSSEWIELYNRSDTIVDLSNWLIGDLHGVNQITSGNLIISPEEFVIITESEDNFEQFYNLDNSTFKIVEPESWAKLNNENDIVRLVDSFEIMADVFDYQQLFDSNFTFSRVGLSLSDKWVRSATMFGTPGKSNTVFIPNYDNNIEIILSSKYLKLSGSDSDVSVQIKVILPKAAAYSLRIYNRKGRIVKEFYETQKQVETELYWDGRADNNEILPVGIYIIYVEAENIGSAKETIVVVH